MAHFHNDGVITVSLVRRANKAAIEGKRYAQQIDAAVPRLPKLTAVEINNAWASANKKSS